MESVGREEPVCYSKDVMAERLQCLQEDGEGEVNSAGKEFLLQEGLLNRCWEPSECGEGVKQSILPKQRHDAPSSRDSISRPGGKEENRTQDFTMVLLA